jgi:hypothetical protein
VTRPGTYRLASRLAWGDATAEAEPVAFRVEPLRPAGATVGLGVTADGRSEIFATVLHRSEGGGSLFLARFAVSGRGGESPALQSVVRIADVARDAADPLVPATNFFRTGALFNWTFWREGRALLAQTSGQSEAMRLELEREPTAILRPAICLVSHELDLFLVDGDSLALARFFDPDRTPGARPSVLWKSTLPAPFLSGAAAIEPAGGRDARHLAWVSDAGGPPRLHHTRIEEIEPPRSFDACALEDARPIGASAPALAVSGRATRVGLVVRSATDGKRCLLVETVFEDERERDPVASIVAVADLPSEPRFAHLAYFAPPGRELTRAWIVEGADGKLYAPTPSGGARVVRERIEPGEPLAFVALREGGYLLESTAAAALALARI